ncbi:MAG TPA: phenylalanine--tRNA ligase subunit beta [Tepidisphaeraceae bacterium]|nr:phenylalanine--tRNA ligase subunit beta [Tepidisphaeraceae bacterium]
MTISLEWLASFLPGPAVTAEQAAEALTFGGLPVEVIERVGDDTVIDVEVTSNRSDCLSHAGVARELAALLKRQFVDVQARAAEAASPAKDAVSVRIDAPQLCPHYTARVIRGVTIKPSPGWMQRRLTAVGLRPINNVVDVTNYVMFETGQPLHAFDHDRIGGRQITVRAAAPGEKLLAIDGHERPLAPNMLVIADASKPVALAGVMGGKESEVSDRTANVLLEAARFDPLNVRSTARRLVMGSDSSYRFERGIDPTLPLRASLRAAQLILGTAGGELLGGVVQAGAEGHAPKVVTLRVPQVKRLLGAEFPVEQVVEALARVGLRPERTAADAVRCTVPSHRLDIAIEADLIEEVARVIGYDKIPVRDEITVRVTPPEPERVSANAMRDALVAGGYFEAVTFSFVPDALAGDFVPPEAASLPRADGNVRKADAHLRPSILPGLLEAVKRNENAGASGAKLFEIGSTFWQDAGGKLHERRRVGLVGSADYREVRGAIEVMLAALDREKAVTVTQGQRPGYGAAGRVTWGSVDVGWVGVIAKPLVDKLGLREPLAVAELDLEPLLAGARHVPQLRPLPKFPAVRRDLSVVVPDATRYEAIASAVREANPQHVEDVEYVTTYKGKPLEKGTKSVTIALVFRSPTTTLTGEQVEAGVAKVVAVAKAKLGAALRG